MAPGAKDRVGVHRNQNFILRVRDGVVERRGFSAVGLRQDQHVPVLAEAAAQHIQRGVFGAIVHHHKFEIDVTVAQDRFDGARDHLLLVIRGDNHRDWRMERCIETGMCRTPLLNHRQGSVEQRSRQRQVNCPQKQYADDLLERALRVERAAFDARPAHLLA